MYRVSADPREVDMCCGNIANKGKLLEEFDTMERVIIQQQDTIDRLNLLVQTLIEKLRDEHGANTRSKSEEESSSRT